MDLTIEKKLKALWKLQQIDSSLDNIKSLMGELPMEVSDLEDEITGLGTRTENIQNEIKDVQTLVAGSKTKIKECEQYIIKFKEQLTIVKNNREYDALNKEVVVMELEIQRAEKAIREFNDQITMKKELLDKTEETLQSRKNDLVFKQEELENIQKENEEEQQKYLESRSKAEKDLDERLIKAYSRIRKNVKNGFAVAPILRGSCGGCFAKIPPQRQSDIKTHFKITDCEHCGRILVDAAISGMETIIEAKEEKPTRRKLRLEVKAEG